MPLHRRRSLEYGHIRNTTNNSNDIDHHHNEQHDENVYYSIDSTTDDNDSNNSYTNNSHVKLKSKNSSHNLVLLKHHDDFHEASNNNNDLSASVRKRRNLDLALSTEKNSGGRHNHDKQGNNWRKEWHILKLFSSASSSVSSYLGLPVFIFAVVLFCLFCTVIFLYPEIITAVPEHHRHHHHHYHVPGNQIQKDEKFDRKYNEVISISDKNNEEGYGNDNDILEIDASPNDNTMKRDNMEKSNQRVKPMKNNNNKGEGKPQELTQKQIHQNANYFFASSPPPLFTPAFSSSNSTKITKAYHMMGAYAQLLFNFYCPYLSIPAQNEEYSNLLDTYDIAWATSIWVNLPPIPEQQQHVNKHHWRTILVSGELKLYVNEQSYVVLEFGTWNEKENDQHTKPIVYIISNSPIELNSWIHIGLSFVPAFLRGNNSSSTTMNLYIDGKLSGTQTIQINLCSKNDHSEYKYQDRVTRLGQDFNNDFALHGHISNLAIWLHDNNSNNSSRSKQVFRDAFIIRSSYLAGLDESIIQNLDQRGLVKSPSLFYPFSVESINNDQSSNDYDESKRDFRKEKKTQKNKAKIRPLSSLDERMQKKNAVIYYPYILYHPEKRLNFQPIPNQYPQYINGSNNNEVHNEEKDKTVIDPDEFYNDEIARLRLVHVKNAMKHAWSGYRKHAWGKDEILPLTKTGQDNWGGMATTMVDSLDTLWLMNMKTEFWEARDYIRDNLDWQKVSTDQPISVFETTIRNLGGLLSAYDLSGDKIFMEKAESLGRLLLEAFDSPSGLPFGEMYLVSNSKDDDVNGSGAGPAFNKRWMGSSAILSEIGTLQIEFGYLSHITKDQSFKKKADNAFNILKSMKPKNGLYPLYVKNELSTPVFSSSKISLGAMGDSFYEYMLKLWLQSNKCRKNHNHYYRQMYDESMDGVHDVLLKKSSSNGFLYVTDYDINTGSSSHKMEHLACFLPGLLALGAYTNPLGLESERAQRDLKSGKALAYTCYQMYAQTKTGMAPEHVLFKSSNTNSKGIEFSIPKSAAFNILRPETVESLFILYQLTRDNTYRDMGWEIFRALEKHSKVEAGYGSLYDVNNSDVGKENLEDKMESFFLAETIKYLYLLFDPDTEIDIFSNHVFNTEAHPLRVFDN